MENLTRDTIDISEYLDFYFYDLVWYWETLSGEKGEVLHGRWLNVSHRVGAGMWYWVLNEQGNVISRYTIQMLPKEYIFNPSLK